MLHNCQTSRDTFPTPPQWSLTNTDSSDRASSQWDSRLSDSEQEQSSSTWMKSEAVRPKPIASISSTSTKGGLLASVFASFFQLGAQKVSNERTKSQAISPGVRAQAFPRLMTASSPKVQQSALDSRRVSQPLEQRLISVPQSLLGEINIH